MATTLTPDEIKALDSSRPLSACAPFRLHLWTIDSNDIINREKQSSEELKDGNPCR